MLPPPPKSKAASIWSFDSGYGSNTLEDEESFQVDHAGSSSVTAYQMLPSFTQRHTGLGLGGSWNVQLRSGRPDSPVQTLTTKLNVFTTKVGSIADFQFPANSNSRDECISCQLWKITNPGENLKCDDCSGKASFAPVNHRLDEELNTKAMAPQKVISRVPQSNQRSERGSTRCSACEISALIDPTQSITCVSCTPEGTLLSPSLSILPSKVKRSSAQRPPTKLESHALRCLQGWLRENRSNPYPDADTKRSLAGRCGITEKQVNTWFTNARARRKLVVPSDQSNPASEDEGFHKSRLSSVTSTSVFDYNASSSYTTPFDSGYSDESHPASNNFNQTGVISCRRGKKKDYGQISLIPPLTQQTSSVVLAPVFEPKAITENEPEIWQCTFCYQQVARKSWRRHEETQHRPKRKWTCLHTGPTLPSPSRSNPSTVCVFCMIPDPSDEHLQRSHRIAECSQKCEDDRTFLRPDHLRQHVKNFHKSSLKDIVRDSWRREGLGADLVENWTCGFCAQELKTWDARETHVTGHFKDGLTMADWKGYVHSDEKSKKRPTSSEGRPNVFAKLARTLTGRSTRQQQQPILHNQFSNAFDQIPASMDVSDTVAPLLPDFVFDSFMADVCGNTFAFGDPNGVGVNVQYESTFPEDESLEVDFDALAGDFLDKDISDLMGLWYQ